MTKNISKIVRKALKSHKASEYADLNSAIWWIVFECELECSFTSEDNAVASDLIRNWYCK